MQKLCIQRHQQAYWSAVLAGRQLWRPREVEVCRRDSLQRALPNAKTSSSPHGHQTQPAHPDEQVRPRAQVRESTTCMGTYRRTQRLRPLPGAGRTSAPASVDAVDELWYQIASVSRLPPT